MFCLVAILSFPYFSGDLSDGSCSIIRLVMLRSSGLKAINRSRRGASTEEGSGGLFSVAAVSNFALSIISLGFSSLSGLTAGLFAWFGSIFYF